MAKQRKKNKASKKARNRHYQKAKHRESCVKSCAENYYKQQAEIINSLKPVAAAARRFNDRSTEIGREIRNAAQTKIEQ